MSRASSTGRTCSQLLLAALLMAFAAPSALHAQIPDTSATSSLTPADTAKLKTLLPPTAASFERQRLRVGKLQGFFPNAMAEYASPDGRTGIEASITDFLDRQEQSLRSILQRDTEIDSTRIGDRRVYRRTRTLNGPVMSELFVPVRRRLLVGVVALHMPASDTTAAMTTEEVEQLARKALRAVGPQRVEAFIEKADLQTPNASGDQ